MVRRVADAMWYRREYYMTVLHILYRKMVIYYTDVVIWQVDSMFLAFLCTLPTMLYGISSVSRYYSIQHLPFLLLTDTFFFPKVYAAL